MNRTQTHKGRDLLFYVHFTTEGQCQATTTLCDYLMPGIQQALLTHRIFSTGLFLLIHSFFCHKFWLGTKANRFSGCWIFFFNKLISNKALWCLYSPACHSSSTPPWPASAYTWLEREGMQGGQKSASQSELNSVLLELHSFYVHITLN